MSSREMSAKGNLRTEMPRRLQVISEQEKVGDVERIFRRGINKENYSG